MVEDLEGLVEKYGGFDQINALWKHVAGRPFFSDEQIKVLREDAVESISLAGVPIVLLGTAHTSRRSAQLAEAWVTRLQPSVLVLERCPERFSELAWPKALLMDRTSDLRAVEVAGRGEVSVDELRRIQVPSKVLANISDSEMEAIASNLWAEFELLNTERNAQVEEAAFLAWTEQLVGNSDKLLALADQRASLIGMTSGEGGGGPDREALLASMHSRNLHICGCIAACAHCSSGPILAILGQHHLSGVRSILKKNFGAQTFSEANSNPTLRVQKSIFVKEMPIGLVCSGALLRDLAITEMAQLHATRQKSLKQDGISVEDSLNDFIADVEGDEALFRSFVQRGLAIDLSSSSIPLGAQKMIDALSTWVQGGAKNRCGGEMFPQSRTCKL